MLVWNLCKILSKFIIYVSSLRHITNFLIRSLLLDTSVFKVIREYIVINCWMERLYILTCAGCNPFSVQYIVVICLISSCGWETVAGRRDHSDGRQPASVCCICTSVQWCCPTWPDALCSWTKTWSMQSSWLCKFVMWTTSGWFWHLPLIGYHSCAQHCTSLSDFGTNVFQCCTRYHATFVSELVSNSIYTRCLKTKSHTALPLPLPSASGRTAEAANAEAV